MKLWHFVKRYADWLTLILILVLAIGGAAGYMAINGADSHAGLTKNTQYRTYDSYTDDIYKTEPPDPKYPPPAKEQNSFYRIYTPGNIQYSVEWSIRSRDASVGPHTFTINLYNSRNNIVTLDASAARSVTIGCIAKDKPYRELAVETAPLTFAPYEKRPVQLQVGTDCLYIGTADKHYFWRIY